MVNTKLASRHPPTLLYVHILPCNVDIVCSGHDAHLCFTLIVYYLDLVFLGFTGEQEPQIGKLSS